MTNTVGRVNFTARLDGRGTERDAENIGRSAGAAAGDGYDKTWSKSFKDSLTASGKAAVTRMSKDGADAGTAFGKAVKGRLDVYLKDAQKSFDSLRIDQGFLDKFAAGFDDAGLAAGKLQEQIKTLRDQNQISEKQFESARKKIDAWADSQRQAAIATNDSADASRRYALAMDAVSEKLDQDRQARENSIAAIREHNARLLEQNSIWKESNTRADSLNRRVHALATSTMDLSFQWSDLSHNTRQWTLIIGAVMAGMQDIAVLGSAAGAGLITVGGAATSGIIGIGGLAAVLVTLNKDLDELPPSLRNVASEFKAFTPVFGELRETIASGAFQALPGVFDQLGTNLRSLTPELRSLGREVGLTFGDLAKATKPGSDALEEIRRSVALAGPNFRSLAGAAGDLGVAFLRAFNESQPMVEDLIGYVQRLADQFDEFTRSDNFGLWMANASKTFASLGPLIDATGRALNDLVTPASVQRTAAFLDNLTAFMPNLTRLLDMLGRLDLFGRAAQLLNDFGVALEPLAGPVGDLAEALSGVLSIAINEVADALNVIAKAIAPTVQGVADFISALPPDVLAGLANGVLVLAGAFVVLKGSAGIAGAVSALTGMGKTFDSTAGKAGKLGNALSGALGKAGLVGLAVGGAVALTGAIAAIAREIDGTDDKVRNLVAGNASLKDSYNLLNGVADGLVGPLTNTKAVLNDLARVGNPFENFALAFSETGSQALALSGTLKELDGPIASLAQNNLPAASAQFSAYATELGATREQTMTLLEQMPGFKEALIQQAEVLGIAATDSNLLTLALGETSSATDVATEAIARASDNATLAASTIDNLAEKIRNFGEDAYGARDAARDYYASLDELNESIQENGTTLDITTEAGRNNEQAIDDLARAVLEHSAATLDDTGSIEESNAAMADGREKLIDMLEQFGITGQAAEDYADDLGLIPNDVATLVRLEGVAGAEAALGHLVRTRTAVIRAVVSGGNVGANVGVDRPMASGGILTGPTHVLAGEAGREAFVPLDRPLNMIDESVRWLAAIAQGKSSPTAMASGGIAGGGRNVTIEAGAIVVMDSGDAGATANEVMRQVSERLNG